MRVVTAEEMVAAERYAYSRGFQEEEFMEAAGRGVAKALQQHWLYPPEQVILLVGKGNNGGDAFVAGRHLLSRVNVIAWQVEAVLSPLSLLQKDRFIAEGGTVIALWELSSLPNIDEKSLFIDGLCGTGFRPPWNSLYSTLIDKVNRSGMPIAAIDIPSGIHGSRGTCAEPTIKATVTFCLEMAKWGCFSEEAWPYVGIPHLVSFGLPHEAIEQVEGKAELVTEKSICPLIPPLSRTRHKYQRGSVAVLAGSIEMAGAALLTAQAAMRAGCGIVHLYHPEEMICQLTSLPAEIIRRPYTEKEAISDLVARINDSQAVVVGPGLGRSSSVETMLSQLLPRITVPTVIDADALFFLAHHPHIHLPPQTVLTPHVGELKRLLQEPPTHALCGSYAQNKKVTLIRKGSPTWIYTANERVYLNPWGNPGMATAGSGDVLAGIIASLLAQQLEPMHAAIAGCYIHSCAGDCASDALTAHCVTASDILNAVPSVFKQLHNDSQFWPWSIRRT